MALKILVLPGDGIGPDIIAPAEMALDDSLDAMLAEVNSWNVGFGGDLSTKAFGQIFSGRLSLDQ